MEDKIIEAIMSQTISNNHITKTNTSIDQGQLMEAFESMKANGIILNKPKGKRVLFFY